MTTHAILNCEQTANSTLTNKIIIPDFEERRSEADHNSEFCQLFRTSPKRKRQDADPTFRISKEASNLEKSSETGSLVRKEDSRLLSFLAERSDLIAPYDQSILTDSNSSLPQIYNYHLETSSKNSWSNQRETRIGKKKSILCGDCLDLTLPSVKTLEQQLHFVGSILENNNIGGDQPCVGEASSGFTVHKRRSRTSPTRSSLHPGFSSPKPVILYPSPPRLGSAFSVASQKVSQMSRSVSASAAQSAYSRLRRSPSSRGAKSQENSLDMEELTLKDLGTPVTEAGSPAVMEINGVYNAHGDESPLAFPGDDFTWKSRVCASTSPGGVSFNQVTSDSDINSSLDSNEGNVRFQCKKQDWMPHKTIAENGIFSRFRYGESDYEPQPKLCSPRSSFASLGSRHKPPRALHLQMQTPLQSVRSFIDEHEEYCRTPLLTIGIDDFISRPGSADLLEGEHRSSDEYNGHEKNVLCCSIFNSSLTANTTAGSISVSLSRDDSRRQSRNISDSGCSDSTDDNNFEESRSNLDNSVCSGGSQKNSRSASSPHPGLALLGVAVEVKKNYSNSARKSAGFRPLPDPSAFDSLTDSCGPDVGRKFSSRNELFGPVGSPAGPVCPPSPKRTPHWGDPYHQVRTAATGGRTHSKQLLSPYCESNQKDNEYNYENGLEQNDGLQGHYPLQSIYRQSSLAENKILLKNRNSTETEVTFSNNFEHLGILGKGVFGDVYLVRSLLPADSVAQNPLKLFAVKKSRHQFRSKSDREWLLNEVQTMKMLDEAEYDSHETARNEEVRSLLPRRHCDHVVQFIRAWQEDSYFYVQIELIERGSLKDLINRLVQSRRTVPESTLWFVAHDVAAGIFAVSCLYEVSLRSHDRFGTHSSLRCGASGHQTRQSSDKCERFDQDRRFWHGSKGWQQRRRQRGG